MDVQDLGLDFLQDRADGLVELPHRLIGDQRGRDFLEVELRDAKHGDDGPSIRSNWLLFRCRLLTQGIELGPSEASNS